MQDWFVLVAVLNLWLMRATCAFSDRQTAKAALLCVDFGLGCSAAFNEVSTSNSIKLLTVTEYSNASAQLGTDSS